MENTRRLSLLRVFLAILLLAGILYAAFFSVSKIKDSVPNIEIKPWFASYVDVTATPRYTFELINTTQNEKNLVLSFIVSSKTNACTPTWGTAYTLEEASSQLDLDRRIARFRQLGGNVAISFGGLLNDELAVKCTDNDKLIKAYKTVIDRYNIDTLDLDIEGASLAENESVNRRAEVMAELQKIQRSENKNLAIWMTLPVSPQGLTQDGTNAVATMLSRGVDLSGVNLMTMDYGQSWDKNYSLESASESALKEAHRQLGILFSQAGINLNEASLWKKIGATPMIGQNDVADEVFSTEDATLFNKYAVSKGIARMSMWSANRDIQCGENYVNTTIVSDSCSGVKQEQFGFANILSKGFDGDIASNATKVTVSDTKVEQEADDPTKSPYQIWNETATYLEGTKVVWHHNVYQAKWWTQGELPDNPVLEYWETPWQLIGPVMPGETPIPQVKLAPGTYPEWSGTVTYEAGNRILFKGVPYQAKWWTLGDSPAASSSNPDGSPWRIFTQRQIEQLLYPSR